MLMIILAVAIICCGAAWGWYRGLSKVVTAPTALLLSFLLGKLCSPLLSRLLAHTALPPLFLPLVAAGASRAALFPLIYFGLRRYLRQQRQKRLLARAGAECAPRVTALPGQDFFTSQVIEPASAPATPQRREERIECWGGATVGVLASAVCLSIGLAVVGIAGDLQKIASGGTEGLFLSMKRGTDNALLNALRSAANPVDDQAFSVFTDYLVVVSNPELMDRLLDHPGMSRLAEDPRIRALMPPIENDPDGTESYAAQQRAMASLLTGVGAALKGGGSGATAQDKQLATVLSDQQALRELTAECDKVFRDVIDAK